MLSNTVISRRRSSPEIVAEILKLAKKGARKTRIVYSANLNFKMLAEYLTRLEEAELVTLSSGLVTTTTKGKQYLEQFSNLRKFYLD